MNIAELEPLTATEINSIERATVRAEAAKADRVWLPLREARKLFELLAGGAAADKQSLREEISRLEGENEQLEDARDNLNDVVRRHERKLEEFAIKAQTAITA